MIKKLKQWYEKTKKCFWTVVTILLGLGLALLAGIFIFYFYIKDLLFAKTKKRTQENDEIIKEGLKNSSDTDDFIKRMRSKYN